MRIRSPGRMVWRWMRRHRRGRSRILMVPHPNAILMFPHPNAILMVLHPNATVAEVSADSEEQ